MHPAPTIAVKALLFRVMLLACALALPLAAQALPLQAVPGQAVPVQAVPVQAVPVRAPSVQVAPEQAAAPVVAVVGSHAVEALMRFKASDVKFELRDLMEILRDREHEGWVLAAYPDPKTGHPLIGAGVSLDLPERPHPQTDPLNPHDFIEPSSAELWQAAGLDPHQLEAILAEYDKRLVAWSKRGFRRKIGGLAPEITDEEAGRLLRVSAIQAIYNAKGYCRDFDKLTAPQQMAMSQLVYQMGVNLAEFSQFLALINHDATPPADAGHGTGSLMQLAAMTPSLASYNPAGTGLHQTEPGQLDPTLPNPAPLTRSAFASEADYWKAVQTSLVESQWARLYRARAVAVIAMLDPAYSRAPAVAERRVGAMLRPAVVVRRRVGRGGVRQRGAASGGGRGNHAPAKAHAAKKRGV